MSINDLNEQRQWYDNWHSSGPHELPVETLKQAMRLFALEAELRQHDYRRPLIIGCGTGDELRLTDAPSIVAFDLSRTAVHNARTLVPSACYLQADGMRLPFSDNTFDLALSSEVLEHILQPEKMLAEVARVLQPGGKLVISTPNWRSFFGLARWMGETLLRRPFTSDDQPVDRWATPSSLTALLHSARFAVISQRGAWYFPPTGVGMRRLPDHTMAALFKRLLPAERRLQRVAPGLGHLLIVTAQLTV